MATRARNHPFFAVTLAVSILAMGCTIAQAAEAELTRGKLEVNVTYKGDDGAVHPLGPVALRLTCTNPVAFSHVVRTGAGGHLRMKVPSGKCTLESASPARLGGKRYTWHGDVEILPAKIVGITLSSENAVVQGSDDSAFEAEPSTLAPPAATETIKRTYRSDRYIAPPQALVEVDPEYPDLAEKDRIQKDAGVSVSAWVNEDGSVSHVSELVPLPQTSMFRAAAILAASQNLYLPARQDGKPVGFELRYFMAFRSGATVPANKARKEH